MSGYAGTGTLVRLALRRDRVLIPVCVVGLVALAGGSARSTVALYPDPAQAVSAARAAALSPAIVGMYGPIAAPDNPDSIGAFKTLVLGGIFLAIFAFAIVRRHTRTEEEAGRTELVGAGVVGRRAPLTAAVLLSGATVLVTSMVAGLSMAAAGLGLVGSLAFATAWAGIGLSFVGVTAVAAQLTGTARGCAAVTLGTLGVAYLLRAVGDTTSGAGWLTWLSPIGWAEKVEVFGANRIVVALLPLAFTVGLVALAFVLLERRDLGSGLVAARPGPAGAAASLRSPLALAWRLQRGLLLGWAIGFAILGLVLGAVAGSVSAFVDSPEIADMLAKLGGSAASLGDTFISTELHFMAVAAAAYGISAALRLKSEEADLHTEQVLATPASRPALLGGHALIALGGSALLMLVLGAGLSVGAAGEYGGLAGALGHLLPAALAPVPAVWVCVGLALVVYGALPKVVVVAWALLAAFLVVGEFGPLFNLPTAVVDLSPFSHGAMVPGGAVPGTPLAALALLAAALVLAAGVSFRRRDLVSG
ncbi:MAG: polyketide antibiotic transporter [Lapillicoccus sp.]